MTGTLLEEWLALLDGLGRSIIVSAIGIALGVVIGTVFGGLRFARVPVLGGLIAAYVNLFRCTPLLVQIFMLYFALPEVGIRLSAFETSWLALGLWGGAYQVEVMRAGFESVSKAEILAARALGMPSLRTFLDVTLPLGFRAGLPNATTTALTQFRSSSFMIVVSYNELTYVANRIVSDTFEVFRVFGTASLMYLVVSLAISLSSRALERSLRIPGLGLGR